MCKPDALPLLVLHAGSPEQIENPLEVLGVDSATVVLDVVLDIGSQISAAHIDPAHPAPIQVLDGIFNQIPEDLLDGEAVAREIRNGFDDQFCATLLQLMCDA